LRRLVIRVPEGLWAEIEAARAWLASRLGFPLSRNDFVLAAVSDAVRRVQAEGDTQKINHGRGSE